MAKPAAAGGAAAPEKKGKKKTFKKKERKHVSHGIAHIQASFNNTIVTIADQAGNVLSWKSQRFAGIPRIAQRHAIRRAAGRIERRQSWRAITACAASKCESAARVPAASRPSARWPRPASKCATSKTPRRSRTTAAVRRSAAEFRRRRWSVGRRSFANTEANDERPKTSDCFSSGTKGEAKPVNRSSKGEATWHVILILSAVSAAARA